jgi:mRNA-degrading endonuclease RelE of RelBE toxin-antitoxin system
VTGTARRDFDRLDEYARDRIASKLDKLVDDEWRQPAAYL